MNLRSLMISLWFIVLLLPLFGQNNNWIIYTTDNSGLPDLELYDIAIDYDHINWILASNSLIKYDGVDWEVFDPSNSIIPTGWAAKISKSGDGNVWIGGFRGEGEENIGLIKVSTTPWVVYDTSNSELAFNDIAGLTPARDGGIWINSWSGFWVSPGTVQKFNDSNWFTSSQQTVSYIGEMEEDLNGNLWYVNAYASGGVFKIYGDSTSWYYFLDAGATHLETDLSGNVWMAWVRMQFDSSGLLKYDGEDWVFYNQSNSDLPASLIKNLVVDSLDVLWMSGSGLIRYDGTNFTHFTPQNSELYSTDIRAIQVDEHNNKWIIHGHAISVFNEDGVTSIIEEGQQLPDAFKLEQNYPNPFNPTTSLQYTVGSLQFVTLKVYDVLGKEIATLISEEKPAGEYGVEFNGTNLPSGIYFYRIQAGSYSETRKMVLLR